MYKIIITALYNIYLAFDKFIITGITIIYMIYFILHTVVLSNLFNFNNLDVFINLIQRFFDYIILHNMGIFYIYVVIIIFVQGYIMYRNRYISRFNSNDLSINKIKMFLHNYFLNIINNKYIVIYF